MADDSDDDAEETGYSIEEGKAPVEVVRTAFAMIRGRVHPDVAVQEFDLQAAPALASSHEFAAQVAIELARLAHSLARQTFTSTDKALEFFDEWEAEELEGR